MRFARIIALVAVLVASSPASGTDNALRQLLQALGEIGRAYNQAGASRGVQELLLFGGPGHNQFLGCLNCSDISPASVSNLTSGYGFANDFGVWNSFGQYASRFSMYSACNQFATDPPVIVDRAGNAYGRFTINQFAAGSVCGVTGNAKACEIVTAVCRQKG